ncbi:MAG TPA: hypothetical protein EYP82_07270 [Hydrogenothermaceae bacterium]|nr:hypothetical protein [Hydrogenothermaceae bacterium]
MVKKSVLFLVLSSLVMADDPLPQNSVATNVPVGKEAKKDKGSPFERGFRFGDVNSSAVPRPKTKRSMQDIPEEMLKVQKKQLKTQKRILEIIENEFDPQPKKIVVNGKECIENSSAECFKMPLLHPDGKKVPVLGKFVTEPTVENAREYLKWHAKFLKSAFKGGEAITLAVNKFGPKAYPLNYDRFEYDTPGAYSSVLKERNNKAVLDALSGEVEIFFFFGKNADADTYALDNYAKFAKDVPNIKYSLVFYNKGSQEVFNALASRLRNIAEFKDSAKAFTVSPQAFKANSVYATPTVTMYLNKKKKMRTILVGRNSSSGIIANAISSLEFDEVLKDAHSPGFKAWERTGDYSEKHYKEKYGEELNSDYIKEKYREGN